MCIREAIKLGLIDDPQEFDNFVIDGRIIGVFLKRVINIGLNFTGQLCFL